MLIYLLKFFLRNMKTTASHLTLQDNLENDNDVGMSIEKKDFSTPALVIGFYFYFFLIFMNFF